MGWFVEMTVKGYRRVGAWTGTLNNPTKCLWRGNPTVGTTSSSVRLHIYAPSHILLKHR